MKFLKTFETLNESEPKIGSFVIAKPHRGRPGVENEIGVITHITGNIYYRIKYYSTGWDYFNMIRDIEYWSDDRNELKTILTAKKYNL
jgi:hypothetical protein